MLGLHLEIQFFRWFPFDCTPLSSCDDHYTSLFWHTLQSLIFLVQQFCFQSLKTKTVTPPIKLIVIATERTTMRFYQLFVITSFFFIDSVFGDDNNHIVLILQSSVFPHSLLSMLPMKLLPFGSIQLDHFTTQRYLIAGSSSSPLFIFSLVGNLSILPTPILQTRFRNRDKEKTIWNW
jgi:hypothetical protein